jgi:putative membrane protein
VGIVSFAQLLGWLFRRYHDLTVALLIGLMLGSLRKVWPWKVTLESVADSSGELLPVVQQNELPPLLIQGAVNPEVLIAGGLAVAGFAVVVILERWAKGPA